MEGKIITCHYAYNYGAVLQTYALCDYLNSHNIHAEVINYRPYYYKGSTKSKNKFRLLFRKIIRVPDNIKAEKIFYSFLKENVSLTKEYKDYKNLCKAKIEADLFIAGSDQIWNMNLPNGRDDAFYLRFIKQGKKISYAASLSAETLSEEDKIFLNERLKDFDAVSVRERTGKALLSQCGIENVHVVLDPVYLMDRESWRRLQKKPSFVPDEKYILVYAFNRHKYIFDAAKRLAHKMKYKVYAINTFWEDILMGMDHYYWNCKPEEFLYLIDHAQCVVTNSFHGLSFSLIFNKAVVLFEKDDNGNSRMLDLIDLLGLRNEILSNKENAQDIEIKSLPYEKINGSIEKYRNISIGFLNTYFSKINKR